MSYSDYDVYANYRGDPYAAASGQPPALRHDLAVAYQQQQQAAYPPPNQQRQQPAYGSASGAPALAQYYGAQQRA